MPEGSALSPAQVRAVADIRAELARLARYDDESVVNERWIRQRYEGFYSASYLPARSAAVVTAWHEAGSTASRWPATRHLWLTRPARSPSGCGTGPCPATTRPCGPGWPAGRPTA